MKGCYFYSSPSVASMRRSYEDYNSMTVAFMLDGKQIRVEQDTTCSSRNVYYKMTIFINDEVTNKNIRFIKSILKNLEVLAA